MIPPRRVLIERMYGALIGNAPPQEKEFSMFVHTPVDHVAASPRFLQLSFAQHSFCSRTREGGHEVRGSLLLVCKRPGHPLGLVFFVCKRKA